MAVRVLSFHAGYACRHAGACCTSGWPIPVEVDRLAGLRTALASDALGRQATLALTVPLVFPDGAPADAPAVLGIVDGRCVFYHAKDHRCEIHRALGHDALPLACRQFPRVSVRDPRGASVTLSHYCPTAAAMLSTPGAVGIVTSPPAFPADAEYEGLDASRAMPPLLRPDMLMDWDAWWDWERRTVDLVSGDIGPGTALARLRAIVDDVRRWRPSEGPLIARIGRAFAYPAAGAVSRTPDATTLIGEIHAAMPGDLHAGLDAGLPAQTSGGVSDFERGRFLAAHAFASWTAHLGPGLRTWLRSLDATLAVLDACGDVGRADLVLRHLADPNRLADVWSRAESEA
jgi:Fe-S-cluster containining protein